MKKSHLEQLHSPNKAKKTKVQVVLTGLLCLLASACVDVRSAAHSTTGFLTGETSSGPHSAGEHKTSPISGPAPDVVGYVTSEVTFELAEDPGQVSAFGLGWIALPSGSEPVPVRDLPDKSADVVGSLAGWESDFWVAERTRQTSAGKWRRVTLKDGAAGWVEARFLLAQPPTLSASQQRAIRSVVAGTSPGLAVSDDLLPASVHVVTAEVHGEASVLLLDWSGREVRLIGLFAPPEVQ